MKFKPECERKSMLCEYSYVTQDGRHVGVYQTDTADFRNMIRYLCKQGKIRSCVVVLQNGDQYIGYVQHKKFIWKCIRNERREKLKQKLREQFNNPDMIFFD